MPDALRLRAADTALWLAAALAAASLLSGLLLVSPQAALAAACVFGLVALYATDRRAGVVGMLAFWFVAPMLRRVLQLETGYVNADPLSLAPFLATAAIVALELGRVRLSPKALRVLGCAAAGLLIGLPAGLVAAPFAAVYAATGYLAAIGAAVLGYVEASSGGRRPSLDAAVRVALPAVAAYALLQTFAGMPAWDQTWLDAVNITSVGVAGEGAGIRAFGTLNAPGTLAGVAALGLVWYLAFPRPGRGDAAGALLLVAALAVTYVRGAWIALLAAVIAHLLLTRGRSAPRVLTAAIAVVLAVGVSAGANPAAGSLIERVSTLGSLEQDQSAQTRVATPSAMLSAAVSAPAGSGLGRVGEASRLGGSQSTLRYPDNAYLSVLVQSGLAGFALLFGALAVVLRSAWRLARRAAPRQRAGAEACFSILVYMAVLMLTGDHLYGAVGVVFWLVVGYVLGAERRESMQRETRPATPVPEVA